MDLEKLENKIKVLQIKIAKLDKKIHNIVRKKSNYISMLEEMKRAYFSK
jgi:predicted RNase H-like nuclease (RuvC/YqgF family)